MIITLKKFLLFGLKGEIDRFFKAAQRAGFIEFLGPIAPSLDSAEIKDIAQAIKILKAQPTLVHKIEIESLAPIVNSVLEHDLSLRSLREEERLLRAEIDRISPLGNFSLGDIAFIEKEGKKRIQFFCISTSKTPQAERDLIYVNTEYDLDYYISIQDHQMNYPDMIELQIEQPVGLLKERLRDVHKQSKEKERELKRLAAFLPNLEEGLQEALSRTFLKQVKEQVVFPTNEPLFVIEAWVPENHIEHLYKLIDKMEVHAEEILIEKQDRVPTYMENKGLSKVGEDLVLVYDVPAPQDKDPSTWVLFSFALFFAVITADAGYGFLYLALAVFLSFKFRKGMTRIVKRLLKLTYLLSLSCIVWGVLTASFFGMKISPDAPIRKVALLDYLVEKKANYHIREKDDVYQNWLKQYPEVGSVKKSDQFFLATSDVTKEGVREYRAFDVFSDNLLMEIALFIGVVHLILSMGRYALRNYASFGWILFTIGGYLYFPSLVDATSMVQFLGIMPKEIAFFIGKILFFGGLLLAMLLGIIQRKLQGIMEVMNSIQIFSDVLSYLRLYALGLAGMILATTFNQLGSQFPLFIGFFIILIGQAVNISLALMSGLIHGLRLNFLEWYHYSFEGEGKLFNPLRKF